MNAPNSPAQAKALRRRTAAVFVAVGALVLSSGLVMLTAPAASAGEVGICHATGSDTAPYNFIRVDASSTDYQGHLAHAEDPDFEWKKGTWWNGTWYPARSPKPDLIAGKTFFDGPITEALCNLSGTGAIAVTPSVGFTDPTCANDNSAAWAGTDTDKVTYTVTSGSVTPGSSVTVTAAARPGYVFPNDATTSFDHSFPAASDCREVVTPQNPTVIQPACTGPGTSSALNVTPATTAGVTYVYDSNSRRLTATAAAGKKFGTLPTDWTSVSETEATFQVPLVPAGDCLVTVSASAPAATDPSCTTDGSLALPSVTDDGYHWTGDTSDGVGSHTVTAVADQGYTLTGQVTWTITVLAAGSGLDCSTAPTPVTPLEPRWVEASCTTDASVDYTEVTGVQYVTTGTVAPGETATVTASTVGNHAFGDGAVTTWSHTFNAKPSGAVCDGGDPILDPEPTLVTPLYPSATAATCSRDGELSVPAQPTGVDMTQSGSVPGDVTFTFAPASGYVFAEGTDTEVTVPVQAKLTGEECILGEESTRPKTNATNSKPKPRDRAPIVLGAQEAIPTAVAAGVMGLPSTSVSSTGSPWLAQALVAGGLLMLVAGGSMGLGRRTRGVHES